MAMRSLEIVYDFSKSGTYYNIVDVKGEINGWKAQERKGQTQRAVAIGGDGDWKAEANDGTTRCVTSVIGLKKTNHTRNTHPTEKPLELYKWLIERYCPEGGTILDPTAGSFNSCFAAYELNRNAIGIEKDDAFYEKATKRADLL
jgi:DNA modification methylase